jgi:hypothetical protein
MVFAEAEQQLQTIRTLLKYPTRAHYAAAVPALEQLMGTLRVWTRSLEDGGIASGEERAFAKHVQQEFAALRQLFEGPMHFFVGLNAAGAAGFGSYARSGTVQHLASGKRTLAHL